MLLRALPFLSIVVLLFPMGVFMLTTPPLLVLKHDTPNDARFIRGLFNLYYVSVMIVAAAAAVACAAAGKTPLALAMAGLVAFAYVLRRRMIPAMDALHDAIGRREPLAVPKFRRLHIAGMGLNVVQLGVAAWGLSSLVA